MDLPFQLPENREFDVAGFGTNAVDHLIRVKGFPEFGGKGVLESSAIEPGGEVASTMVGLQRLGFKTAYAGSFGDDEAGRLGLRSLEEAGVNTEAVRIIDGAETQVAYIFVDERSGERTILWRRHDRLRYSAGDAPVELADRCRILHMTPHDTGACIAMARAAKSAGTILSLDIDNVFDGLEDLLPLVDICLASEAFPTMVTGLSDRHAALKEINSRFGCSIVGMTLGRSGSSTFCEGQLIETPAFAIPGGCVDTTGAGDAFRTGFLYGVLSGLSVEECARSANAVAALKCRQPGARRGSPVENELLIVLKNI